VFRNNQISFFNKFLTNYSIYSILILNVTWIWSIAIIQKWYWYRYRSSVWNELYGIKFQRLFSGRRSRWRVHSHFVLGASYRGCGRACWSMLVLSLRKRESSSLRMFILQTYDIKSIIFLFNISLISSWYCLLRTY